MLSLGGLVFRPRLGQVAFGVERCIPIEKIRFVEDILEEGIPVEEDNL